MEQQLVQMVSTIGIGLIMLLIGRFLGKSDKTSDALKGKEEEMLKKLEGTLVDRVVSFEKSFKDSNSSSQKSLEELGSKYNKLAESVTEISSKQKEMQAKIEGNDKLIDQRFTEQAKMLYEIKELLSRITTVQVIQPETIAVLDTPKRQPRKRA